MEWTFEMSIQKCVHVSVMQTEMEAPKENRLMQLYNLAVLPWLVWSESQSTGTGKWKQECAISVKQENTVPKTSVLSLRVVPFNNTYTDFLIQ